MLTGPQYHQKTEKYQDIIFTISPIPSTDRRDEVTITVSKATVEQGHGASRLSLRPFPLSSVSVTSLNVLLCRLCHAQNSQEVEEA